MPQQNGPLVLKRAPEEAPRRCNRLMTRCTQPHCTQPHFFAGYCHIPFQAKKSGVLDGPIGIELPNGLWPSIWVPTLLRQHPCTVKGGSGQSRDAAVLTRARRRPTCRCIVGQGSGMFCPFARHTGGMALIRFCAATAHQGNLSPNFYTLFI